MGAGQVKVSEMKSAVWGFGVLRNGGYFIILQAFIGGCRIGPNAAWIEIKVYFSNLCF